jgi:hypothetical protein
MIDALQLEGLRGLALRGAAFALVLGLAACDRFGHPRYDPPPAIEGAPRIGAAVGSSTDTGAGGGTGSPVAAPAPDACGGGGYADPGCDACMSTSCCFEEAACASDPSCGAVDGCVADCADDPTCVSICEDAYDSSRAAADLGACLASSCSDACP